MQFPQYMVLDGGLGTELTERCGNAYGDLLWTARFSHTREDAVEAVQKEFLEAGADAIMTNTYSTSVKSAMTSLSINENEARAFLEQCARSTCSTRDQFWQDNKNNSTDRARPLAMGALGPHGAGSESRSDYSGAYVDKTAIKEMADLFLSRSRDLLQGGVDILGFETIPAAREAEAICLALRDMPSAKAWIVFCCKDGEHVGHGETFAEAVMTSLTCDAVVGVGVNCTEPSYVTSLLKQIPDVVKEKKRIVVYPNAGKIWDKDAKMWRDGANARPIHEYVSDWLDLGANWIGGCCFVPPSEIRNIRREMDMWLSKKQ